MAKVYKYRVLRGRHVEPDGKQYKSEAAGGRKGGDRFTSARDLHVRPGGLDPDRTKFERIGSDYEDDEEDEVQAAAEKGFAGLEKGEVESDLGKNVTEEFEAAGGLQVYRKGRRYTLVDSDGSVLLEKSAKKEVNQYLS